MLPAITEIITGTQYENNNETVPIRPPAEPAYFGPISGNVIGIACIKGPVIAPNSPPSISEIVSGMPNGMNQVSAIRSQAKMVTVIISGLAFFAFPIIAGPKSEPHRLPIVATAATVLP